ncbi:MAG TPA: c-type cytochrome [Chloroflexota bacterium]|nr:c-type cytochrome [Chloroflexota bacterium]HUM67460.1 c-type cytochrome [Chloroflexota bacterium]
MKKYLLLFFAWSALLAACQSSGNLVVGSGDRQATPLPPAPTLSPDAIALGQQVYVEYCAACHGAELEGEPEWKSPNEDGSFRAPPHDASGHTWHHSDSVLIEAIRLGGARLPANIGGSSNMPAYDDILTEAEMLAVLAYIKRSWPAELREAQWEQTAQTQP